ncbi:MAG: hypothetical protein CMH64_00600 [Nanoarchaeota archaeon]|nr:hypothetical protein [Nanoarchaeota archaeon]|tara:strand:+ start:1267 stop:1584 length:318 start_codon:yes stop_codon:yes gene_type:complete
MSYKLRWVKYGNYSIEGNLEEFKESLVDDMECQVWEDMDVPRDVIKRKDKDTGKMVNVGEIILGQNPTLESTSVRLMMDLQDHIESDAPQKGYGFIRCEDQRAEE